MTKNFDICAILLHLLTAFETRSVHWAGGNKNAHRILMETQQNQSHMTDFSIKVKTKLSLCYEHHATKAYWESGGIAPHIL
jgi:hypothetical protein